MCATPNRVFLGPQPLVAGAGRGIAAVSGAFVTGIRAGAIPFGAMASKPRP